MSRYRVLIAAGGFAACLWAVAATSATAQPPFGRGRGPGFGGPPDPSVILERMDQNKDGKLTKDEVPEAAWGRLSRADADNDGVITKDELAKLAPLGRRGEGRGPEGLGRGSVGPKESPAAVESDGQKDAAGGRGPRSTRVDAIFQRLDKNGDGVLSKEEFSQAAAQRREFQRRAGRRGGPPGFQGRGPRDFGGSPAARGGNRGGGPGGPAWMQRGRGMGRGGPPGFQGRGPRDFGGPPAARGGNRGGGPGGPAWMQRGRGMGRGGPPGFQGRGPRDFGGPPAARGGNRGGGPGGPAWMQRGRGMGRGGPPGFQGRGPRDFGGPPAARGGNRGGGPGGPAWMQRGRGMGRGGPPGFQGQGPRDFGGQSSAREDETESE